MTQVVVAPIVKVSGTALDGATLTQLVSVEIDRGLNLVGRATLRFIEKSFDLVAGAKFALGTKVSIHAPGGAEIFSGEVTGVSLDQAGQHRPSAIELTVTVDDATYKLSRNSVNKAHLNTSYADVISAMLTGTGLSASTDATGGVNAYLLQTGTNLDYLNWIVDRCGMFWWVDATTLNVKKTDSTANAVSLKLGESLLRLSIRASARHPGKMTVTGWDAAKQEVVKSTAATTQTSEATLVQDYPGRKAATGDGILVNGASPLTTDEAQQVSKSMLAVSARAAVTTRGTTLINANIKPSTKVTITDAGKASGDYVVAEVRHRYDSTGFYTHFTAGPIRPEGLVDLLGGVPESSGGVIGSMLVGVISNLDDPDNKGRVKATLPTLGANVESEWARIVSLGGGKKRGVVFYPEVGDEVLIAFEEGDTRRPVVIGGVFSAKNELPNTDNIKDGKVQFRRITSALGHVIEIADGADAADQHILFKTKKGHRILLSEEKLELEVASKPVLIKSGDASIEFSNKGDVTISGADITLKATGNIKLEATGDLQTKSTGATKVQGTNLEIKADATGKLEATGPLTIKGAMVAIN